MSDSRTSSPGDLAERLERNIHALSRRCIDAMYEDPFWQARFADRGRRHAEEDSAYHVKYIVSALRAGDSAVFLNYARWLRGVLAARGMCSWHLSQSFGQLAAAMHAESMPDVEPAEAILQAGTDCLRYENDDAASELQGKVAALRTRVETTLGARVYRLEELISFVLDALARADHQVFVAHVGFLSGTLARDADERQALRATLAALREAAVAESEPATAARAAVVLDAVLA